MRVWYLSAVAALGTLALVVLPAALGAGAGGTRDVHQVGLLVSVGLGAIGCVHAARHCSGRRCTAWVWIGIGTASWVLCEAVGTCYEVVLGRGTPAWADVGFLTFPLACAWGLLHWWGGRDGGVFARGRDLIDGVVIAGSLVVLSWITVLSSVAARGDGDGWFAFAVSLAYPIGDIVVGTLALLGLARARHRGERTPLLLLALGLLGVGVADSTAAFLASTGPPSPAHTATTAGWVLGFALVGVAGFSATRDPVSASASARLLEEPEPATSRWQLALPYIPLVAANVSVAVWLHHNLQTPSGPMTLALSLVGLVMVRQYLALLENQRLVLALAEARDVVQHQALHDALTGLPNRVLFADRLDQALLRPTADVSVMFCDLDDFKTVNDMLGHDAGDDLLQVVARRLQECVRTTDTVARFGGDEFAVLVDGGQDCEQVAERIVSAMASGAVVAGQQVTTSISVGFADHRHDAAQDRTERRRAGWVATEQERKELAARIVRAADAAMYVAKSRGKNQIAAADSDVPDSDVPGSAGAGSAGAGSGAQAAVSVSAG